LDAGLEADWCFLPWSELLVDFDATANAPCGAVGAMLRDYASSTRALLAVLDEVTSFIRRGLDEPDKTLSLRDVVATPAAFRALRIHDLIGKHAFSVLQAALTHSLDCQRNQPLVGEWRREAEVFMTRGTPGLCIEYRLTEGAGQDARRVSVGVQIQGTTYRHYLSASHPTLSKSDRSLQSLAELVRGPTSAAADWWALGCLASKPLKKFDASGFLYAGIDAALWTFWQLRTRVAESMKLAAALVQDASFSDAAQKLLQSRRSGP
jgi:hypothetical protein